MARAKKEGHPDKNKKNVAKNLKRMISNYKAIQSIEKSLNEKL